MIPPGLRAARSIAPIGSGRNPDALAAALDWRTRLLVLGPGYQPEIDTDGRLGWTSLAAAPEDAELVLLGLADGRAHVAAITGPNDRWGRW